MTIDLRNLPDAVRERIGDANQTGLAVPIAGRRSGLAEQRHATREVRAERDVGDELTARHVGYALLYDTPYEVAGGPPWGWVEEIAAGACTTCLRDDVRYLLNHEGLPMARTTAGTLTLEEDDRGLISDATVDLRIGLAADTTAALERRDIDQMSFAFRVAKQEWNDDYTHRRIIEFEQLFDTSVVTYPANPNTVIKTDRTITPDPDLEARRRYFAFGSDLAGRRNSPPTRDDGQSSSWSQPESRAHTGGADIMNMSEMVRRQLEGRLAEREALRSDVDKLTAEVEARDGNPTDEDLTRLDEIRAKQAEVDGAITTLRERVAELDEMRKADDDAKALTDELAARRDVDTDTEHRAGEETGAAFGGPVTTRDRGSVYQANPDMSFIADAVRAQKGNSEARDRLVKSAGYEFDLAKRANNPITLNGQEFRDVTTAALENVVIPAYLLEQFAPLARAGAPLLAALRQLPLPGTGMTVELARTVTGTSAAVQAAEGDAPSETDIDVNQYSVPVVTIAGKQDVSRQSIDRGANVDELIIQDMLGAYYTAFDAQLINGSGGSGQHRGVLNVSGIEAVTYDDASPTAAEAWPKLADAAQRIASNRFMPLDLWVLHPRRYGWFYADTDSAGRPLIVPMAAQNPIGVGGVPTIGGQGTYTLAGAPVLQDANVPTTLGGGTEDIMIGLHSADMPVFVDNGGTPRTFRFDQLSAEEITLAVWGYSAFASGRYPKAIATVGGSGTAAPTF